MPVHTIDWYRTPLDSKQLAELNERSDKLAFMQAGGYLAAVLATGTLAFLAWMYLSWPWVVAAVFLHGTVGAFMINGVHELVHGTVFKTKWLNSLFAQVFAFLGWINHYQFWCSHTEHHKFTLHQPDDLEVVLPVPVTIWGYLKIAIINPMHFKWALPYHWRIGRGKFHAGWETTTIVDLASASDRWKVVNWSRFLLIGHAAVIVTSIVTGYWILAILISVLPMYGLWLFWLCNNVQHVGLVDSVPDFRLCCRTIELNPVTRFLYWQMNYHIEHHMYAGVPCYKLPRLHKAILKDLPPCPNGLLPAWVQIGHIMARQKLDPKYQYVQPLPGNTASPDNYLPVKKSIPTNLPDSAKPVLPKLNSRGEPVKKWECSVCGFIYDEALGLPEDGIAPGTAWLDIPEDWSCPDCGVAKSDFTMVELTGAEAEAARASTEDQQSASAAPSTPVVIVGSGLAGYSLAKEIRSLGIERPVMLLTRDGGEFYSKPMLSNALKEKLSPDALVKSTPAEMAHRFKIDVKPNVVVERIDRERKVVVTHDGEVPYGHLVLAVGADQITVPMTGDGVGLVHQVNDLVTYAAFRSQIQPGGRVLIIGAGLIGCEFANDLIGHGCAVDVVDVAPYPLSRLIPAPVGEALKSGLAGLGVRWHFGTSVHAIGKTSDGKLACQLSSGEAVEADLVLSAVGLRPRINLAQQAGLAVKRGIVVDTNLRTSDPDIFAVGDCAEVDGKVMPYVHPIFEGIRALAHTMGGTDRAVVYPVMPVVVKTPACELVVCPPEPDAKGQWSTEGEGKNLRSIFTDPAGERVLGFVLCGAEVSHKNEMAKRVHHVAAPSVAGPSVLPATSAVG